jgi:hypothetical protein
MLLNAVFQAAAADAPSFYATMLRKGLATYAKGDYPKAYEQLRIAAFGLLDDTPQYELAEVHLLILADKLHYPDESRIIARRFAAAERLGPVYATLRLDPAMRHDFEQLLPTLLTPEQMAALPSLSPIVLRGAKNWSEVIDLYSDVRTRRRLTSEESASLFNALVQGGRLNDAAGMRALLSPTALSSPAVTASLSKLPPVATSTSPMTSSLGNGSGDVSSLLRDADKAISEARCGSARQIYQRLSQRNAPPRDVALEIARGLHRSSALKESSTLYQKLYPLQHGEEKHMFAEAVNRYELGDVATARLLLGRALTGLNRTPELSFYLPRIESGH